jgi:glycosyltransferase involved in cell wall biosynthesis
MRIALHDYGGYAFTVQLARELARRKHQVLYLYSASTQAVQRGDYHAAAQDLPQLEICTISLDKPFEKYNLIQRRFQEAEYGRRAAEAIAAFRPGVILSANTPLDAQVHILKIAKRTRARFIFWVQDLISVATRQILSKRSPWLGKVVGAVYSRVERRLIQESDGILVIADDFLPTIHRWRGQDSQSVRVIPNWAPLEDFPALPKRNPWSIENDLQDKFLFLYSGILGLKHNPELLLALAGEFSSERDVQVGVISAGAGAQQLQTEALRRGANNLVTWDFQPIQRVKETLASADVLTAILNPDAASFSVPSKVLTYFCAGRPVLLSISPQNAIARLVSQEKLGLIAPAGDAPAYCTAARTLFHAPELRSEMGQNARQYAEKHFNIQAIGDSFEDFIGTTV